MNPVIELHGVSKRYGRRDGFELKPLDLTVEEGTITGLVGANGAGKTTLIKLILGLIRRDAGTIRVLGKELQKDEVDIRRQIGVVFDEPCFHDTLSPREVGSYLRGVYPGWDDGLYRQLLERFGLPESKDFKTFSRGMKMKLSLAAALSHHPHLLILDEPTSGLDPLVRDELLDLFLEFLQEDCSILLSSHITSDLDKVADSIVLIDHGRLLFHEEKDELRDKYVLVRCGEAELAAIDPDAVKGIRKNAYGIQALCLSREITLRHPRLTAERPTIEEIMLFFTKDAVRRESGARL
ncbi:MAG: ABC transporter ATP-binding protein [Clostridiales bacterium]|nr:ABC transporter ATP-binding protein [Clostridiales bacterium]